MTMFFFYRLYRFSASFSRHCFPCRIIYFLLRQLAALLPDTDLDCDNLRHIKQTNIDRMTSQSSTIHGNCIKIILQVRNGIRRHSTKKQFRQDVNGSRSGQALRTAEDIAMREQQDRRFCVTKIARSSRQTYRVCHLHRSTAETSVSSIHM